MFGALTGVLLLGVVQNLLTLAQVAVVLDPGDLRRHHPVVADRVPAHRGRRASMTRFQAGMGGNP